MPLHGSKRFLDAYLDRSNFSLDVAGTEPVNEGTTLGK